MLWLEAAVPYAFLRTAPTIAEKFNTYRFTYGRQLRGLQGESDPPAEAGDTVSGGALVERRPEHHPSTGASGTNALRYPSRSTRCSGLREGAVSTSPSTEKREPWQGQSQLRSAPFQATVHLMCEQAGSTACR